GSKSVTFTPELAATAEYEVFMWYPSSAEYYGPDVPVDILHTSGTDTVLIDQSTPGGAWESLGVYTFDAGTSGSVTIRNDGTSDYVVADAVKFTPIPTDPLPPEAADDAYDVEGDTTLTVDADSGVLANDSDPNRDALTAVLDADVSHGTLTLNADGSFSYTPAAGYEGTDTFTYHAEDPGGLTSDPATVTLTVSPVAAVEVVMEDSDATGVTVVGDWKTDTFVSGYYGTSYLHDRNGGKGSKSVTFTPELAATAEYEVFMWYPSSAEYYGPDVPVDVAHAGGTDTVLIDQSTPGGAWESLGVYTFDAGTSGSVTIRNDGTSDYVVADAVKFTPVS
ncbi:MAG: Ig-like domain-containing protein, partial [Planctomycetota bacterium]